MDSPRQTQGRMRLVSRCRRREKEKERKDKIELVLALQSSEHPPGSAIQISDTLVFLAVLVWLLQ